jgi:tripeptidyl-peptidase-1
MGPETNTGEVACEADEGGVITTGGGFSSHYPAPEWQQAAVSAYFDTLPSSKTPTSGYNPNGRAYPDVSMIGVWYQVVVQSEIISLFGTSASSPVFAAMLSLVNAARVAQGMPSVGFINPTLYAYGMENTFGANGTSLQPYNDVIGGDNKCTSGSPLICCKSGFYANAGWDPVTGWGSIFYPNLGIMFGLDYTYVTPSVGPDVPVTNAASSQAVLSGAALLGAAVAAVALLVQ